jgi:hypothetical protein
VAMVMNMIKKKLKVFSHFRYPPNPCAEGYCGGGAWSEQGMGGGPEGPGPLGKVYCCFPTWGSLPRFSLPACLTLV